MLLTSTQIVPVARNDNNNEESALLRCGIAELNRNTVRLIAKADRGGQCQDWTPAKTSSYARLPPRSSTFRHAHSARRRGQKFPKAGGCALNLRKTPSTPSGSSSAPKLTQGSTISLTMLFSLISK
jgi:hypothetical protein